MSYRVLARTYRSNTFDEVVGQETIATTLKNAITSQRVHHGYLFTGTRGVGKTSMARILAKALNCLEADAPTITPCCTCDSCRAVALGEDVDVVEIDAASNTGVDNIRELRSNASLRPARARFKIYIIDEVHMLSTGAFNALLKTLEEPPSHVKFILATTESQKVPATIQSRCQRFDFHAIDVDAIATHLGKILELEKVEAEEAVLGRIARLANGSMRDALSLMDKVLSYESERLTTTIVDELIPPPHDELASAVMEAVAKQDAAGALEALDTALQTGRTVERFCNHLVDHARTLLLMRVCGTETPLVDVAASMRPQLAEQAALFDAPTYVYMITLLEELRRSVKFSGAARALADAAIVRLAMSRQFTNIDELIQRLEQGGDAPAPPPSKPSKKKVAAEASAAEPSNPQPPSADDSPAPRAVSASAASETNPVPDLPPAGLAPAQPSVSSTLWDQVARDPFVQRVKEAVDGQVKAVHPARRGPPSVAMDATADGRDENQSEPVNTE